MNGWRQTARRSLFEAGFHNWWLARNRFPGVAVLCYHSVRPDDWPAGRMAFEGLHVRASELDTHCAFLKATCQPITLAQWRAAAAGGPPLPERPVLVTFDDGYRSMATVARPILQRHGVPAVLFLCTEAVERRQLHWFDAIGLTCGEAAVQTLKQAPFDEWRTAVSEASTPVCDHEPHALLTVNEIGELAREGFEIGGHTDSHPILARADRDEQEQQIARNRTALEAWSGKPVAAFAYPNGERADYTAETVALLEQSGYQMAFTAEPGFADHAFGLECSRYLMRSEMGAAELAHCLHRSGAV